MPRYKESRRISNLEYVMVLFTKYKRELFDEETLPAIVSGLKNTERQMGAKIISYDIGKCWVRIRYSLPPEKAPNSLYNYATKNIGNAYRRQYPERAPWKTTPFFTSSHIIKSIGSDVVSDEEIQSFLITIKSGQRPQPNEFRA